MIVDEICPEVSSSLTPFQMSGLRRLSDWNLEDVEARARMRMNWTTAFAREVTEEYRKFLALVVMNPDATFGMVDAIDELWHQHILNTRDYYEMCLAIVGGIIHHDQQPLGADPDDISALHKLTIAGLASTFLGPINELWANSNTHSLAKCCKGHVSEVVQ